MDWMNDLIQWYKADHRDLPWRRTRDPYAIWLSEIMLQQTRVAAVVPYYERFLHELPTVRDLAAVDDDRLMKLWQGLGYYSRARNLKRAAVEIVERFGGALPGTYAALLTLPGVGAYTAGAIASIAFGERVPAVDGNVLRVMARLCDDPRNILDPHTKDDVFAALQANFPDEPGTFNQAMMELGAMVCTPKSPQCELCPVRTSCRALQNGTVQTRPVREKKQTRAVEQMTVFVLRTNGGFLIRKRPDTGLLAGLYELPHVAGCLEPDAAANALTALGVRPTGAITRYDRKHVFTHKEWHMRVYAAEISPAVPEGWLVYDGSQSLPTAFAVCLD